MNESITFPLQTDVTAIPEGLPRLCLLLMFTMAFLQAVAPTHPCYPVTISDRSCKKLLNLFCLNFIIALLREEALGGFYNYNIVNRNIVVSG